MQLTEMSTLQGPLESLKIRGGSSNPRPSKGEGFAAISAKIYGGRGGGEIVLTDPPPPSSDGPMLGRICVAMQFV